MSERQRFIFNISFAVTLLFSPTLSMAQHGSAGMAAAHASALAAPMAMHAPVHVAQGPHSTLPHPISNGTRLNGPRIAAASAVTKPSHTYPTRANSVYRSNTSYNRSYPYNDYPAPGLGFDYVHYAAVHPNTGHNHFRGTGIIPFYGGYYFPWGGYGYSDSGTYDDQAAAANQSEQPIQSSDAVQPEVPVDQSPAPSVRSKPVPVPPSPEYIFVRRDGSVFFAVAYSWANGNLQYVTQDGFRKLASMGTLDLDATTQFNEQRGVPFHSPA